MASLYSTFHNVNPANFQGHCWFIATASYLDDSVFWHDYLCELCEQQWYSAWEWKCLNGLNNFPCSFCASTLLQLELLSFVAGLITGRFYNQLIYRNNFHDAPYYEHWKNFQCDSGCKTVSATALITHAVRLMSVHTMCSVSKCLPWRNYPDLIQPFLDRGRMCLLPWEFITYFYRKVRI